MTAKDRLIDLVNYVEQVHRLSERVVTRLQDYRDLLLHETDLKAREGIQHDLIEGGEAVWLKIDRLRRTEPPEPSEEIRDWISVSSDPSKPVSRISEKVRTITLRDAEKLLAQGLLLADDVIKPIKASDDGIERRDVILRLHQQPGLANAITSYIEGPWRSWAEREQPRRETIAIYEKLFALEQSLEAAGGESAKELVWGLGLVRWHQPPIAIDHCLIEQLVEIEVDPHDASLRIRPRSTEPFVYIKPFFDLGLPGAQIVFDRARKMLSDSEISAEINPFQRSTYEAVLRLAATQLETGAVYYPDVREDHTDRSLPPLSDKLIVSDHWTIYGRARADNFLIQDLARLKDAIGAAENDDGLPPAGRRLVQPPEDKPRTDDSGLEEILRAGLGGSGTTKRPEVYPTEPASEVRVDSFFFPKPFNKEQVEIVRRLEKSDGLVVQGPPGTGKTHTIANLICHYMAMGRRVLVTAQSEAALTVLRDHLPPEIRSLAVALLTSEREGLRQLERAAGILATEASQVDSRRVRAEIEAGQERVLRLREELAGIDRELELWAQKHLSEVGKNPVDGRALRPIDLARKVADERDEHAWFVDRPDGRPQFSDADIQRLVVARRKIGQDLGYIGAELPSTADLPNAAQIAAIHTELVEAKRLSKEADLQGVTPLSPTAEDALARAEKLTILLRQVLDYHELVAKNSWLATLDFEHGASPTPLDDVIAEIKVIAEEWKTLIRGAVHLPDDALSCQAAEDAIRRLAIGQKPFPLVSFGKAIANAKELLAGITVSGERLSTREQARTVLRYLDWRRRVIRGIARWNALWPEYDLPKLDGRGEAAGRELIRVLEAIRARQRLTAVHAPALRDEGAGLFPHARWVEAALHDATEAKAALHDVEMNIARKRLTARAAVVRRVRERFTSGSSQLHTDFGKFLDSDLAILADQSLSSRIAGRSFRLSWSASVAFNHSFTLSPRSQRRSRQAAHPTGRGGCERSPPEATTTASYRRTGIRPGAGRNWTAT
jgi:AAA domain